MLSAVSGKAKTQIPVCGSKSCVPSSCVSRDLNPVCARVAPEFLPVCTSVGLGVAPNGTWGMQLQGFYCMHTWKVLTSFRVVHSMHSSREVIFQKSILGEKTVPYITIHLSQLCLVTFLPASCKVLTLTFSSIKTSNLLNYLAVNLPREIWFSLIFSESLISSKPLLLILPSLKWSRWAYLKWKLHLWS